MVNLSHKPHRILADGRSRCHGQGTKCFSGTSEMMKNFWGVIPN